MKNFIFSLLSVGLMSTPGKLSATSIVAYQLRSECKYIVLNNENLPIATWLIPLEKSFPESKNIEIIPDSKLWRKLKKLAPSTAFDNITIYFITDQKQIDHWESIKISKISISHFKMGKDFRIASNVMLPAQDYNSSRSNKANAIASTQDYNSSRSNKANSIATAQDYNSSRSNKANSISENPLYHDNGTHGENPLFEGKNSLTGRWINCSEGNKGSIIASAGFASGNSGGAIADGYSFNIGYQIPLIPIIDLEIVGHYFLNNFEYAPSNLLPEKYLLDGQSQNEKWNSFAITIGPSVNFGRQALTATVYAKIGVLFTNIPERFIGVANNDDEVTDASGLVKFSGNQTNAAFDGGVRINYKISRLISIFAAPYYFTSLKRNISYSEKDVSMALDAEGNFDQDKFVDLPYLKKETGFRNYGVLLGVCINCF